MRAFRMASGSELKTSIFLPVREREKGAAVWLGVNEGSRQPTPGHIAGGRAGLQCQARDVRVFLGSIGEIAFQIIAKKPGAFTMKILLSSSGYLMEERERERTREKREVSGK